MNLMTHPPMIPDPSSYPAGPPLLLDLGGVEAVSAAGIGELVGLHARLGESGGRLVLVGVEELPYQALDAAGLTELLDVRRAVVLRPAADEGEAAERGERVGGACGKA